MHLVLPLASFLAGVVLSIAVNRRIRSVFAVANYFIPDLLFRLLGGFAACAMFAMLLLDRRQFAEGNRLLYVASGLIVVPELIVLLFSGERLLASLTSEERDKATRRLRLSLYFLMLAGVVLVLVGLRTVSFAEMRFGTLMTVSVLVCPAFGLGFRCTFLFGTTTSRGLRGRYLADKDREVRATFRKAVSQKYAYKRAEVDRLLQVLATRKERGVAVGLVGCRGIGKTAVLAQALDASKKHGAIVVTISCPSTRIDEREIVTNAFDRLCHAVLEAIEREVELDLGHRSSWSARRSPIAAALRRFLVALLPPAGGALTGFLVYHFANPRAQTVLAITTGAALATGLCFLLRFAELSLNPPVQEIIFRRAQKKRDGSSERALKLARLYEETRDVVEEIEVEQTILRRLERAVTPWTGLVLKLTQGLELKRREVTLPGLIDSYLDFVCHYVVGAFKKVVIAVDELDRIGNAEHVASYLRALKPILHVPGTTFLFTISQDVVQSLELSSIVEKGEADSALTDLIRLEPLSVLEGLRFLRDTKLSVGYDLDLAVCVLSAGIPRDIVRQARRAAAMGSNPSPSDERRHAYLEGLENDTVSATIEWIRTSSVLHPVTKAKLVGQVQLLTGPDRSRLLTDIHAELADMPAEPASLQDDSQMYRYRLAAAATRITLIRILRDLVAKENTAIERAEKLRHIAEIHTYSPLEGLDMILSEDCALPPAQ